MSLRLVLKFVLYSNSSKVATLLGMGFLSLAVATVVVSVQKELTDLELRRTKERLDFLYSQIARRRSTMIPRLSRVSIITEKINYRLSRDIIPLRYSLYIDVTSDKIVGNVIIPLEVVEPTENITLHSSGFVFVCTTVEHLSSRQVIGIKGHEENILTDMVTLTLNEVLTKEHKCVLYIDFEGHNNQNPLKYGVARTRFPCFDELDIKVPLNLTMVVSSDQKIVTILDIIHETDLENGTLKIVFRESPPMSPSSIYLLTNKVPSSVTIKLSNKTIFTLNIYTLPADVIKVETSLQLGTKVIEYLHENFDIFHPFSKIIFVAERNLPFESIGNWGLTSMKEELLFYSSENTSTVDRFVASLGVAREIVRNWLGGFVTPKWWSDYWLEQGFSNYLGNNALDFFYPTWKISDFFIVEEVEKVLDIDSTLGSCPLVHNIESPGHISLSFERITSCKGAAILRMLEILTESDQRQKLVKNILEKFAYSSLTNDEFLEELESIVPHKSIREFVEMWTEQQGYPVIEIKFEENENRKLELTQKRFFSNPEDYGKTTDSAKFGYRWDIPLTYITNEIKKPKIFLMNANDTIFNLDENVKWFKFNVQWKGFYRVNYPERHWQSLTSALMDDVEILSPLDKASLLEDSFALADANQLNFEVPLNLSVYLQNESSYAPWKVACNKFKALRTKLFYSPRVLEKYQAYARQIFDKAYRSIGSLQFDDNFQRNLFKITIIDLACCVDHMEALRSVEQTFTKWLMKLEDRPQPDLREVVYFFGMQQSGNIGLWNLMWDTLKMESDPQERKRLMKGLAGVKEPWILQKYLELSANELIIPKHEFFPCLQYIAENPCGSSLVWEFIRTNWSKISDQYSLFDRNLQTTLLNLSKCFCSTVKLDEMNAFFEKHSEIPTDIKQITNSNVQNNIRWLESNPEQIENWLDNNGFQSDIHA